MWKKWMAIRPFDRENIVVVSVFFLIWIDAILLITQYNLKGVAQGIVIVITTLSSQAFLLHVDKYGVPDPDIPTNKHQERDDA